jgi:myo-inositol-1-phosphate synthase
MSSVRVAIVGVGNCAASLVQGVHYYRDADPSSTVPGLMHVQFGDYHVRDVEFVAAFDVDAKKVGFDLSEAIFASENNTIKIADVPPLGVTVQRGHTHDGLGRFYRETIEESDETPVDIVAALREAKADVLVSRSSTRCRCSSPPTRSGRRSSKTRVCRSSATTSSPRSAPPSRTACWRSCSRTAASSSTGRCSSTWAGTWTS